MPKKNRVIKKKMRIIVEIVGYMLKAKELNDKFWIKAVNNW